MTWTRRQALRSAASTLWLPLLPSLLPRQARAAESERILLAHQPLGLVGLDHRHLGRLEG